MPFSSQRNEVMIFLADRNIRNLCFPGDVVWHLSIDCYLHRSTNLPTNSIYHKGDLKQDPYWWPTNISTTIRNLITWATWCLGFVHPWPLGFWFKMVDPNFTPITICDRKPSLSVLHQCKRSVAIVFIAYWCAAVSIYGIQQAQTM